MKNEKKKRLSHDGIIGIERCIEYSNWLHGITAISPSSTINIAHDVIPQVNIEYTKTSFL